MPDDTLIWEEAERKRREREQMADLEDVEAETLYFRELLAKQRAEFFGPSELPKEPLTGVPF